MVLIADTPSQPWDSAARDGCSKGGKNYSIEVSRPFRFIPSGKQCRRSDVLRFALVSYLLKDKRDLHLCATLRAFLKAAWQQLRTMDRLNFGKHYFLIDSCYSNIVVFWIDIDIAIRRFVMDMRQVLLDYYGRLGSQKNRCGLPASILCCSRYDS